MTVGLSNGIGKNSFSGDARTQPDCSRFQRTCKGKCAENVTGKNVSDYLWGKRAMGQVLEAEDMRSRVLKILLLLLLK